MHDIHIIASIGMYQNKLFLPVLRTYMLARAGIIPRFDKGSVFNYEIVRFMN